MSKMKNYVKLPERYLGTITDSPTTADSMIISNSNCTFYLEKVQYNQEVYNNIINQAEAYKIVEKSVLKTSENTENFYEEKAPEADCFVIKDDCFVGIFTLCTYKLEAYLHSTCNKEYCGILFTNGDSIGINYDELHRCPGCWEYTTVYSLEKR